MKFKLPSLRKTLARALFISDLALDLALLAAFGVLLGLLLGHWLCR